MLIDIFNPCGRVCVWLVGYLLLILIVWLSAMCTNTSVYNLLVCFRAGYPLRMVRGIYYKQCTFIVYFRRLMQLLPCKKAWECSSNSNEFNFNNEILTNQIFVVFSKCSTHPCRKGLWFFLQYMGPSFNISSNIQPNCVHLIQFTFVESFKICNSRLNQFLF